MTNRQSKATKKLRDSDQPDIHSHCGSSWNYGRLFNDIEDWRMISLNIHMSPVIFYQMPYFLYHPNKLCYLKLGWPIIFLGCCQKCREKKNGFHRRLLEPLFFWHLFFSLMYMKQYGIKTKFFRCVQVYLKVASRVMMYHHRQSGHRFLET